MKVKKTRLTNGQPYPVWTMIQPQSLLQPAAFREYFRGKSGRVADGWRRGAAVVAKANHVSSGPDNQWLCAMGRK